MAHADLVGKLSLCISLHCRQATLYVAVLLSCFRQSYLKVTKYLSFVGHSFCKRVNHTADCYNTTADCWQRIYFDRFAHLRDVSPRGLTKCRNCFILYSRPSSSGVLFGPIQHRSSRAGNIYSLVGEYLFIVVHKGSKKRDKGRCTTQ